MALVNYRQGAAIGALGTLARIPEVQRGARQVANYLGKRAFEGASNLYERMRLRSGRRVNSRPRFRRVARRANFGTSNTTSGRGVTFEHDRQAIYKKRKMPFRRKKGWRRFKRKVLAIAEKGLGTNTVLFNRNFISTNSTANNHGVFTVALYPLKNTTDSWCNDLANIHTMDNTADPTAADGTTVDETTKYFFQSAVLDITMRNETKTNVSGQIDSDATLEVDIYEISMKRVAKAGTTGFGNLTAVFNEATTDTKDLKASTISGVTPGGITIQQRGVTPFEVPNALSRYGLKIWKKTKLFLRGGQTATYQLRDPKRHVMSRGRIGDGLGVNVPGVTKYIFIVYKVIPGFTVGTGDNDYKETLNIGMTRKYMFKVEGRNENRDVKYAGL